jgi:hypothetical protein
MQASSSKLSFKPKAMSPVIKKSRSRAYTKSRNNSSTHIRLSSINLKPLSKKSNLDHPGHRRNFSQGHKLETRIKNRPILKEMAAFDKIHDPTTHKQANLIKNPTSKTETNKSNPRKEILPNMELNLKDRTPSFTERKKNFKFKSNI